MTFNSLQYAAFLGAVVLVVWGAPARRRNVVLLTASYAFYGSWDWRFLALIALSTAIGFTSGLSIAAARTLRSPGRPAPTNWPGCANGSTGWSPTCTRRDRAA